MLLIQILSCNRAATIYSNRLYYETRRRLLRWDSPLKKDPPPSPPSAPKKKTKGNTQYAAKSTMIGKNGDVYVKQPTRRGTCKKGIQKKKAKGSTSHSAKSSTIGTRSKHPAQKEKSCLTKRFTTKVRI